MKVNIPNKNYNLLLFILNDQHTICRNIGKIKAGGGYMVCYLQETGKLTGVKCQNFKTDCIALINKQL